MTTAYRLAMWRHSTTGDSRQVDWRGGGHEDGSILDYHT